MTINDSVITRIFIYSKTFLFRWNQFSTNYWTQLSQWLRWWHCPSGQTIRIVFRYFQDTIWIVQGVKKRMLPLEISCMKTWCWWSEFFTLVGITITNNDSTWFPWFPAIVFEAFSVMHTFLFNQTFFLPIK